MVAPTNKSVTGDIWHLTIDDLLAPLPETARLGGAGPFVISLSASSAPIAPPEKGIAGCQHAHVYQIQRTEDRRMRYRLRLGPFASEDEAEAILQKVRDIYPGALMATADADDLRAIALRGGSSAGKTAAAVTPAASATPAAPAVPAKPLANVVPTLPVIPTAPAKPTISAMPAGPVKPAVSTLSSVPAKPTVPTAPSPSTPTVAATPLTPAKPAIPVLRVTPSAAVAPGVQKAPVRAPAAVPAASAPPSRKVEQPSHALLDLESTQTVRVLTQLELEDDTASRWFVIQLSEAEAAFDPNTVPDLDIFRLYRLYSVAGIDQGRIVHALRLGFFSEEIAAGAVASYLAAFYDKPTIKRVSSAERERFAEQSLEPRKDVGATGKHAVIEITSERYVREKRSGQTGAK
jgi:hypothetical protein